MPEALHARGLHKRFGDTVALDGVELRCAPGEIRGLLGPNGAGKTTLLRILLGLIAPDTGEVELLGRRLEAPGAHALDGVAGFVEDPRFYPYLSARENLTLMATLDGRPRRGSAALVSSALERVGLAQRAGDRVGGFSTGMRQRLGIAAALIRAPRLLLLDEPTSGLDPAGAHAIAALVGELAGDGVAVLLSSHQIGELERICSDYSVMRSGRVVWDGSAEALEREAPASAYELHTSDDAAALALAGGHGEAISAQAAPRGGLILTARPEALERLMADLAGAGVLVRRLEWRVSPLESMFFALTEAPLPVDGLPTPVTP